MSKELWRLPALAAGAVLVAVFAGSLGDYLATSPYFSGGSEGAGGRHFVEIDAIKVANAERAEVASMVGKSGAVSGDSAVHMLQISRALLPTIREVAGPNAIVLVKQAVVSGKLPDITDAVLRKLGLPTKVPTVHLGKYLENAPDNAAYSLTGRYLNQRNKAEIAQGKAEAAAGARKNASAALP